MSNKGNSLPKIGLGSGHAMELTAEAVTQCRCWRSSPPVLRDLH